MTFTAGNVHDSQELGKLVKGCGGQIYADSTYANKKNDKKFGVKNNKILHRAYRNKPLTKVQKQENKQRSSLRYIVERTFGLLKQHHGLGKARYLGLERNKAMLIAMSHNLKTGMNIFKQMRSLQDCCV
jgi:IS5 family transposase